MLRPYLHERLVPALLGRVVLRRLPDDQMLHHEWKCLHHERRVLRRLVPRFEMLLGNRAHVRRQRRLLQLLLQRLHVYLTERRLGERWSGHRAAG
jgi:hypothetical protein